VVALDMVVFKMNGPNTLPQESLGRVKLKGFWAELFGFLKCNKLASTVPADATHPRSYHPLLA
jgi:hypothetical protein